MKYGNEGVGVCPDEGCVMPQAPQESLTERVFAAKGVGDAVYDMARRIRGSLFGRTNETCEEKRGDPCGMEELVEQHRQDLQKVARMLEEICIRLGV